MTRAPDLVEPVVAFRSWRVTDGRLVSPYVRQAWDDGVAEARCLGEGGERHTAPHPDCRCGIHVYFEPRSAMSGVDYRSVLGIVSVWGTIQLHPQGARAQFARIHALAVSPAWSSWHRAAVQEIATRLNVALVDEHALAAVAPEYGSPVPAALRDDSLA